MPVVPSVLPTAPSPAFDAGRGASPGAFRAQTAQAMGGFARAIAASTETLERMRNEEDKLWLEEEYTKFSVSWAEREAEIQRQIEANPGSMVDSHLRLQEDFKQQRDEFMKRLDDERSVAPALRNGLSTRLTQLEGRAGIHAVGVEQNRISVSTSKLVEDRLDMAENEVMSAPGLLASRQEAMLGMINRHREALGARALDLESAVNNRLTYSAVLGQINERPAETLEELHSGVYDNAISPDNKARAISAGYRAIEDRARKAERAQLLAAKAEEERQEANFSALLVAVARNEVDEDFLVDALDRGNISPQAFRILQSDYKTAEAEEGDEDLALRLRLGIMYDGQGIQDVLENRASLSNDQVNNLITIYDQVDRRGGPLAQPDVQASLDAVRDVAAGVKGPFASLDNDAIWRQLRAAQAFTDRLAPDGSNHRLVAEQVMQEYRQPGLSNRYEIPSLPGFFNRNVMDQGPNVILEQVAEAQARVNEAMRNDEMSIDDGLYHLKILSRAAEIARNQSVPEGQGTR